MVYNNELRIEFDKSEQMMKINVEQVLIFNPKLSIWLWIIQK